MAAVEKLPWVKEYLASRPGIIDVGIAPKLIIDGVTKPTGTKPIWKNYLLYKLVVAAIAAYELGLKEAALQLFNDYVQDYKKKYKKEYTFDALKDRKYFEVEAENEEYLRRMELNTRILKCVE